MGIGSTDLSRRTCSLSLPGKCRVFRRKWFTFPRGRLGIGSTGLSGDTRNSLPWGKCREFLRKRFTFPRGRLGYRLHRPLSPHLQSLPPGKVPGFSAKTVHFPPRIVGVPASQASLATLAIPSPGESAGNSCENGSLSPVADRGTGPTGLSGGTWHFHPQGKCREFLRKWFTFPRGRLGYRLHRPLSPHLQSLPPGKVPGFSTKTVHFPSCHETSKEVQQGMLGKVLSIQALWKRYSAGLGVKWWICGKKRAVQQIFRTYILNNQYNAFEL